MNVMMQNNHTNENIEISLCQLSVKFEQQPLVFSSDTQWFMKRGNSTEPS